MEKKTIRLIYPQWQGGDIARWIPEVDDPRDAARGYALGAQMLAMLVPEKDVETHVVPGGMKMAEVAEVVAAVAAEKELVGLTVAEPMPRTAIRLRSLFARLPLLG